LILSFPGSSSSDEFFFDDGGSRDSGCTPRHNIASGSATGLEVFLEKIPEWDSLGEGQLDPNGARVNTILLSSLFCITDHFNNSLWTNLTTFSEHLNTAENFLEI
jgi:hypothetical protein